MLCMAPTAFLFALLFVASVGPLHIPGSVDADITTHDLATGNTLRTDPPCCSSRRSPAALVRAWRWILCAPLRWRPAADGKLMALPG